MLVGLKNLSIYYGSFKAFETSALDIPEGTIGLLGPNGAGKSTVIKTLLGLLHPRGGEGSVLGHDIRTESVAIRGRVGYMPENESFVPGLTAVQFVSLAGELAGMSARDAIRRAHEVLTYLGLEEARYRKIEEYSSGMKQRFKLAQALVHDPDLIILDEPTNGLDPGGRRAMLELVSTLSRDFDKSVILATHLLEDVDQICDRLVVLNDGGVVTSGRIEELRAHWKNRYRIEFHGDPTRFLATIEMRGSRVLERDDDRSATGVVVETPPDWTPRRFFELAAELGDDVGGTIRLVKPDRERLGQLFQRVIGGDS